MVYISGSQTGDKLGVTCDSLMGNAEPKPQCCSVLWVITAEEIFDLKYEKFLLRVIRQNRNLDLGNGLNKFGNHWCKCFYPSNSAIALCYNCGQSAAAVCNVTMWCFSVWLSFTNQQPVWNDDQVLQKSWNL